MGLVMVVHVLTGRAEVRLRLAKCLSANCLVIFADKPVCCYPLTESISPASRHPVPSDTNPALNLHDLFELVR